MTEQVILTRDEIQALLIRRNLIQSKQNELHILKSEQASYWQKLATQYGLDPNTDYQIDNRGVVAKQNKEEKTNA